MSEKDKIFYKLKDWLESMVRWKRDQIALMPIEDIGTKIDGHARGAYDTYRDVLSTVSAMEDKK